MRISDWSSDVCSSDLLAQTVQTDRDIKEPAICVHHLVAQLVPLREAFADIARRRHETASHDFAILENLAEQLLVVRDTHARVAEQRPVVLQPLDQQYYVPTNTEKSR